jgi:single-strand DNA-binding protein
VTTVMNEIWTTVCGNIVTEPSHRLTEAGLPIVKFRVASTPFTYQKGHGFVDGTTSYLTVTCFRQLADNASGSLFKGDPVVAFGRLRVREYEAKDGRTLYDTEIEAVAVGHDLARGTSAFRRVSRSAAAVGEPAALDGSMIREPAELAAAGLGADFGRPAPRSAEGGSAEADAA